MTLAEFRRVYPTAAFTVSSGKLFTYRYYQNPQAKATLVLLTGGIGLSDLFYKHFARFARDFSVLTFDYQLQFGDNGEFADAVAELLRHLKDYGVAPGGRAVLDVPHCEAVPGGQDALPLDLGAVPPDALDLFQGGRLPLKYRTVLPIGRAPQDHPAG